MTQIPFATSAYRRARAFTPPQTLINFLVEKDESSSNPSPTMLLQRPGLVDYASCPAAIQCLYSSDGGVAGTYAVAGDKLYSVEQGSTAELGTMSGTDALAKIAANFDRMAIVAAPLVYFYGAIRSSTSPSFRAVTVPDGHHAVDVTVLNGYFIVACADGRFYWLTPGQDDWEPHDDGSDTIDPSNNDTAALQYATAESDPDGLVAVTAFAGNLFFFGSRTIEVWQTTGDATSPFQRASGQSYQRGCLARDTVQLFDNSILFVGEDAKCYRIVQAIPQKISTDAIDERLKLRTGDPSSWTFSYDGHLLYVLRIPGQGTFAYDVAADTWSEFASEGYAFWRPIVGALNIDGTICGDSETGAIWRLADVSNDAGTTMRRSASATVAIVGKPVRTDSIAIDVGQEAACTWKLRWADADQTLADQLWVDLQARAGADVLTLYRLGQCLQPYRTFEIEVTDDVAVRLSGARVGEAWK